VIRSDLAREVLTGYSHGAFARRLADPATGPRSPSTVRTGMERRAPAARLRGSDLRDERPGEGPRGWRLTVVWVRRRLLAGCAPGRSSAVRQSKHGLERPLHGGHLLLGPATSTRPPLLAWHLTGTGTGPAATAAAVPRQVPAAGGLTGDVPPGRLAGSVRPSRSPSRIRPPEHSRCSGSSEPGPPGSGADSGASTSGARRVESLGGRLRDSVTPAGRQSPEKRARGPR